MNKNKRKNSNSKTIIDKYTQDIYPPYNLYVMLDGKEEDIANNFIWDDDVEIEPTSPDNYQGVTYALVYSKTDKSKNLAVLVCLNTDSFDNDVDAINVISHEAFHVVFRIFKHCNINLSEDTNEPYAFMVGWASKNIYNTYKKAKK